MNPSNSQSDSPITRAPRGVIYVATGTKFIDEVNRSRQSLKQVMPDLPVTLFTDVPQHARGFENVALISNPAHGFHDKVDAIARTPYEKTIFLDTDTWIGGSLDPIFALLDRFDVALAHEPGRVHDPTDAIPPSFPEFNSGVFGFRFSSELEVTLKNWKEQFDLVRGKPGYFGDQTPLRQVLYESNLRIATLPPEYNCRFRQAGFINGEAVVLHGRNADFSKVAKKLNGRLGDRVFFPSWTSALRVVCCPELKLKVHTTSYILRQRGLRAVVSEYQNFVRRKREEREERAARGRPSTLNDGCG